MVIKPNEADKAKANEADEAKANEADKAIVVDNANGTAKADSVADTAIDELDEADEANVDEIRLL